MNATRHKILYINYMLQRGHINFDKIHIKALENAGFDVWIIIPSRLRIYFPPTSYKYLFTIPELLSPKDASPLRNRIAYILTLLYLKVKINKSLFSHIFISNFDEITLGLVPLSKQMYLYCHNTANNFRNKIKAFFIRRLAKNNHMIVFNHEMAKGFYKEGIEDIKIVSHGCVPPFPNTEPLKLKINVDYRRLIFMPSERTSQKFLYDYLQDKQFIHFIEQNKILVVIRNVLENPSSKYIHPINRYLSNNEYRSLFLKSDFILIAYPSDFGYRVSGVSFECVANKKNLLYLANNSLKYCKSFYNYNPEFNNITELISKIENFDYMNDTCIVDKNNLMPDYSWLTN